MRACINGPVSMYATDESERALDAESAPDLATSRIEQPMPVYASNTNECTDVSRRKYEQEYMKKTACLSWRASSRTAEADCRPRLVHEHIRTLRGSTARYSASTIAEYGSFICAATPEGCDRKYVRDTDSKRSHC